MFGIIGNVRYNVSPSDLGLDRINWEALPLRGKSISAIFIAGLAVTSCSTANEPDALDAKAAPKAKTVAAAAPGKITYNYRPFVSYVPIANTTLTDTIYMVPRLY